MLTSTIIHLAALTEISTVDVIGQQQCDFAHPMPGLMLPRLIGGGF